MDKCVCIKAVKTLPRFLEKEDNPMIYELFKLSF